jgi:protein-tyrosine phosphatase
MAEFVLKDMVKKAGKSNDFIIKSSATSYEEIGNDIHYGTRDKLIQKNIPFEKRKAIILKAEDYNKYDYIIGMEESNIKNIKRIVGEDKENKICRLLDFSDNPRDIADPWYTGNFEITYNDIVEGCKGLLKELERLQNNQ